MYKFVDSAEESQPSLSAVQKKVTKNTSFAPLFDGSRPSSQASRGTAVRQIEHQSSLRSLISSSDVDSREMEEEILRQIREEGLLDGIDLENIDVNQEDQISERIAEAFRRRQSERARQEPERRSASKRRRTTPSSASQSRETFSDEAVRPSSRRQRAHSRTSTSNSHNGEPSRPPQSISAIQAAHLEVQSGDDGRGRRRRTTSSDDFNTQTTSDQSNIMHSELLLSPKHIEADDSIHNPDSSLETDGAPDSDHHLMPSLQPEERKGEDRFQRFGVDGSSARRDNSTGIIQNPVQLESNQLNVKESRWQSNSPKLPELGRISGGFGMDIFDPAMPKDPMSNINQETDIAPTASRNTQLASMSLGAMPSGKPLPLNQNSKRSSVVESFYKPVSLKGYLSVSTTTSNSLLPIRVTIEMVLRKFEIRYIGIQGGYRCIYQHLKVNIYGGDSFRSIPLHFEVFIVKMPLLPLHRIHVKRLDGEISDFERVSNRILTELKF